MALKRIGMVLPGLGIYGGINIALNWANILHKSGYHVDLIVPPDSYETKIPFLSEEDGRLLHRVSQSEARRNHYFAVMSTHWQSIASMADLKSDHHAWFMQALEAQFIDPHNPAHIDFDELVASRMNVIAIADWLREHILRHYDFDSKQTFCVLNALDKSMRKPSDRMSYRREDPRIRFMVEGPFHDPRKNVAQTIKLLEELSVPYRWVGSRVDRTLAGPYCFGVEQQVPYAQMPEVYGSVDVLVKASNSEGMFGPPLEMFATGGTAVAWHVQGAEEYMSDRYNSYLVPMNSWSGLREAIQELAHDPGRVRVLQENALATAEAWPTWEDQAEQIVESIESLVPFNRASLIRQVAKNQFRAILFNQTLHREAERAAQAETQLAKVMGSRAMRFVNTIQRGRRVVAPDHSRRWRSVIGMGRLAKRALRRLKQLKRAA